MALITNDSFKLLLIYKDQLSDDTVAGSPLISTSRTIALHLWAANPGEEPTKFGLNTSRSEGGALVSPSSRQLSLFEVQGGNPRYARPLPPGICVWGWWRKPWENHQGLLGQLRNQLQEGFLPRVLLYNQYVRRLYYARLHDVYFEYGLTTVVIPSHWAHACPTYYRNRTHLCGAFFALDIEQEEKDATELDHLFIDSSSFEGEDARPISVIPPPGDVKRKFREMIDRSPTRANLRTVELTMFLLRNFRQRETTADLIASPVTTDAEIAKAFRETGWHDLLTVLRGATPSSWALLSRSPQALYELGTKAQGANSRLTRFDFELFAMAMGNPGLESLLRKVGKGDEFSDLGAALREWVTEGEERLARIAAAEVFKEAWAVAKHRYHLADLPHTYFEGLPAMEAIANAVKHELGRKFYRDHLSHNVRAALLTARLLSQAPISLPDGMEVSAIGFYSGLFHDLALPLTNFPDTIGKIASALSQAQGGQVQRPGYNMPHSGVLDRELLKKSLSYVAMLASVPDLPRAFIEKTFKPWEELDQILQKVDHRLLFEEMLCATSHEHALVSAALVFDYSVKGSAAGLDFDTAVRTLLPTLTGPTATPEGRELASILQAMALHDRRAAAEHHGVAEPPRGIPKALNLGGFEIPAIVSVADEFQEWGRTLGALNEIGAVDAKIVFNPPCVEATFLMTQDPEVFSKVPFSLLEYVLGKFKTIGRFRASNGEPLQLIMELTSLNAFVLQYTAAGADCRINFIDPYDHIDFSIWPEDAQRRSQIIGTSETEMFSISSSTPGAAARDFILARGSRSILERLRIQAREHTPLSSFRIANKEMILSFMDGLQVKGIAKVYHFGPLADTTAPADRFIRRERAGVLEVELSYDNTADFAGTRPELKEPQELPYGHFLDFDWRFTSRTCHALVEFARSMAQEIGGPICYLGCPSLAIHHHSLFPREENWTLLDRGHYALAAWLDRLIPRSRYRDYDAFEPLPGNLRSNFAVVITDPPWYDPYYEIFCRRADELLVPRGILGVTYYPRSLDESKFERFQAIIFQGAIRELRQFGSIEIDYLVPDFERPLQIFRKYEHPALGIYRPGFMDFYQAPDQKAKKPESGRDGIDRMIELTERIAINQYKHMLCRPLESLAALLPSHLDMRRKGIKRIKEVPGEYIAWTTSNIVAKLTSNETEWRIENSYELVEVMRQAEKRRESLPIEPDDG